MEKHFATLKLLDDESEHKLTRTTIFSDLPSTRSRILIEQRFQHPNSPSLLRQYSCEQIVNSGDNIRQLKVSEKVCTDNKEHIRTWEASVPCVSNTWNTNWNLYNAVTNESTMNKTEQDQIEYMEIDKSDLSDHNEEIKDTANFINSKEVTPPKSNIEPISRPSIVSEKEKYEETKKKLRPLTSPIMKNKNEISTYFSFKIIFFMLILILGILLADFLNEEEIIKYPCNHKLNFSNASNVLREKIYGQDKVISSLIKFLETYKACARMGILIGGTGVGKSYTIDIIRKNFPLDGTLLHYTPPLVKVDEYKTMFSTHNLIIFENLKENDISDFVDVTSDIMKFEKTPITILAVFNVEKVSDTLIRTIQLDEKIAKIQAALSEKNIKAHFFGYNHLSEEALEKCIKQAMKNSNLNLNTNQIERVKKSLLISNSGCKGAYGKVQVIGRE